MSIDSDDDFPWDMLTKTSGQLINEILTSSQTNLNKYFKTNNT